LKILTFSFFSPKNPYLIPEPGTDTQLYFRFPEIKRVSTQKIRTMGIFWDIMQQDELDKQEKKARNLEERVGQLEADLATTRVLLRKTLVALEQHLSRDIDGDGITG
jgi:hypothetical protein